MVYFFFYPLGRYAGVVRFYLNEYILLSCYVFQKFRCELRQIYNFFLFRGFSIMKAAKQINGHCKANNNKQSNNIYSGFKATVHNQKIHRLNRYIKKINFRCMVKAKPWDVIDGANTDIQFSSDFTRELWKHELYDTLQDVFVL